MVGEYRACTTVMVLHLLVVQFLQELPSAVRKALCAWNRTFLEGYKADVKFDMAGCIEPHLEVQDFGTVLPEPMEDR